MSTSAAKEIKSNKRSKAARAAGDKSVSPTERPDPSTEPPIVQPLKPRPRLFFVLLSALALWIAVLIFMYFATVYPQLHH